MGYNWDLTHSITWDIPYVTGCISYGNSFSGWSSHGMPWLCQGARSLKQRLASSECTLDLAMLRCYGATAPHGATFWVCCILSPVICGSLIFFTLPMFFSNWTFGEVARSCRALAGYHAKRGPQHTTTGIYCWLIPRFLLVSPPCYINTKKTLTS